MPGRVGWLNSFPPERHVDVLGIGDESRPARGPRSSADDPDRGELAAESPIWPFDSR